ncbi:hypothetical protein ACR6C2_17015 [Streptomyces sp. INA 01156]
MKIRSIITTVSIAALALVGCASPDAPPLELPQQTSALQPCEYEWSNDCYWDGSKRDHGNGRSFIADADGNVTYIGRRHSHLE